MPTPFPHRAAFLATILDNHGLAGVRFAAPFAQRLLSVAIFDHFLRHPTVSLGDEDDRTVDGNGRILDIAHPQVENSFDAAFRMARRNEVLWFELTATAADAFAVVLRARRPNGTVDVWDASDDLSLSRQLSQCIAKWLVTRRLAPVDSLPEFSWNDLHTAATRLANASELLSLRENPALIPKPLLAQLPRMAIPYLRVLAEIASDAAPGIDAYILAMDPDHPIARRNVYVRGLTHGSVDRRDILPLVATAPMYAKPHLSIWGEAFAQDHPLEGMGVRHQSIAACLLPTNPFACHNYSLQLAEVGRREESYRWADRAAIAGPDFAAAHLDCIRRMRHVGRPAQAFAEAQYRCREILDHAASATLPISDWQAPHHAALLVAFVHLDIGRLAEAIELADNAMAQLAGDDAMGEAFAWAFKRIAHWRSDPGVFARAYACEAHHRGDPGRVLVGLGRTRFGNDEDAAIGIDALLAVGRDDEAEIAAFHAAGLDSGGILGDGKARLAAARALIVAGRLDEALEHIQVVQLRRSQSRHEMEIHRLFRLGAIHSPTAWDRVIARRLELGATSLARMAARDLVDFVPGMNTSNTRVALGDHIEIALDPQWISDLIAAVPAAQSTAPAITHRLARPPDDTLAAADRLIEDWWTVLVPPTSDREAHGATALLAFGIAIARYFTEASQRGGPIAGAYRCIATEALHLVRQSRYHIDAVALRALLMLVEQLRTTPEWLFDTWLLRIERAFDAEAEYGAHIDDLLIGLPNVARHFRGDDRISWEVRTAHELAASGANYPAAAALFERSIRAVEAGRTAAAWSAAAAHAQPAQAQLDVHWIAATANPTAVAAPWLSLAVGLLNAGHSNAGFAAACRGMIAATEQERTHALADLSNPWRLAGITTPIDADRAFEFGQVAASEGRYDIAALHLQWAAAVEPSNARRAHHLAAVYVRRGQPMEAIRVLAVHEHNHAPRVVGRMLVEAGENLAALPILRYASRWSASAEDFALLTLTASRTNHHAIAASAGKRAMSLGSLPPEALAALATSLYRSGRFAECEELAHHMLELTTAPPQVRAVGHLGMARALVSRQRYDEALEHAQAVSEFAPPHDIASDLVETMACIVAQRTPPIETSSETSAERQAFAHLEAGNFTPLVAEVSNPSWPIVRAALAACEFRTEAEHAIPVSPRALEAASAVLARSRGATTTDEALARIHALRIRENAYIQVDPPPPLGQRYSAEEFERLHGERNQRPRRPSGLLRFAR
jgi:tetratricopeptide (TPR) repeat protein